MSRFIVSIAFVLFAIRAFGAGCAMPAGSKEPYLSVADLPKPDLQLMLDEYAFSHRWTRHSEAISSGFRKGDRVLGEILKPNGRFSATRVGKWRRAYEAGGHVRFVEELASKVDIAALTPSVVSWLLRDCLSGTLWSKVTLTDDCSFEFAAGLVKGSSAAQVWPLSLLVSGGRCGPWPKRALSVEGDTVRCVRDSNGAVAIELKTEGAGVTTQSVPSLPPLEVGPEPRQEARKSEPMSEVVTLWRFRDYRLMQLGQGCTSCALYSADIHLSDPDAVIVSAATVSSRGRGWRQCPADLRCGVYEFSPPEEPFISGCDGVPVCRVYRLADSDAEAMDVIQLTYRKANLVCVDCGTDTDFRVAHRRWQQARDEAATRCEAVSAAPARAREPQK